MTGWTAERLLALPAGTVIEVTRPNGVTELLLIVDDWPMRADWAAALATFPIRVVSVPVDALLSGPSVVASAKAEVGDVWGAHYWDGHYPDEPRAKAIRTAEAGLRAAIAHVTGGAA